MSIKAIITRKPGKKGGKDKIYSGKSCKREDSLQDFLERVSEFDPVVLSCKQNANTSQMDESEE